MTKNIKEVAGRQIGGIDGYFAGYKPRCIK
jgi:hypothetical protein